MKPTLRQCPPPTFRPSLPHSSHAYSPSLPNPYSLHHQAPGHAESVLAKFVERLEENRVAHHVPGDEGAAAALAEARANRGAAMSVLSPSKRPGAGRGGGSSSAPRAGTDSRDPPGRVPGGGVLEEEPLAKPLRYEKEAPALSKAALKKKKRTSTGKASGERSGAGTGRAGRKKSVGSGRPAAGRTDVAASQDRNASRQQYSGARNVGVEGGVGGNTGGGLGSSGAGGAWSRFGSIAVQQLQRAAEALVGTPRDTVDVSAAERAGQERTREAATSYLAASSSGRRRAHEKE